MSGRDVAALRRALEGSGRRSWRGLEELAEDGALEDLLGDEFPSFRDAALAGDRREFLRIMAASLALAGLAGCSPQRSTSALPYVEQPEEVLPGKASFYATAVLFEGYAQPVLAWSHKGRPTKLEGNPQHPAVLGRTDLFTQAAILDLYDPDRSPAPLHRGEPATLRAFDRLLPPLRATWRATGGEGLRILCGPTTSPTLRRLLEELSATYPKARLHADRAAGTGRRDEAMRLAFRRPLRPLPQLDRAQVVVSLDDDLLGPGPLQVWTMRGWAARRGETAASGERMRLFMAESTPTQTGVVADRRLAAGPGRMPALAAALAAAAGIEGWAAPADLSAPERDWAEAAGQALKAAPGRSLLAAGPDLPPEIGALAAAVNDRLGNAGTTLTYREAPSPVPGGAIGAIEDLVADMQAGAVSTLLVLDANPAYAAAHLGFAAALDRVGFSLHAGTHADETAAACDWHLPLPHALESWGDALAVDGTATILQPLIQPLYESRPAAELLHGLLRDDGASALDLVQATWREVFGDRFGERWTRALHDGFVEGSAAAPVRRRDPI